MTSNPDWEPSASSLASAQVILLGMKGVTPDKPSTSTSTSPMPVTSTITRQHH